MKRIKCAAALLLVVIITVMSFPFAFGEVVTASLYNVYGDGMLFRQNEPCVLSGTATAGAVIEAVLLDSDNEVISQGSAAVGADGKFSVAFDAPSGSFEEYTVELSVNGKVFRTLENVVFGELWLASGQSNMQYPLSQAKSAAENFKNGAKLSKWVRALIVSPTPEYKGSEDLVPAEPQEDIKNAVWVSGEDAAIYSMSAVGFFFAEELTEKLGMPVGILSSSLGGSTIRSWLSREAIDSDNEVKSYLQSRGEYFEKSEWKEDTQSVYYDMTANFNQKISPLRDFRISGMIWYQGESDLILGNTQYDRQLSLLQKSYTEHFSYCDGLLPLIFTKIAAYNYSEKGEILADWNILYDRIQASEPSSRAVVSIYDIPVTYLPEVGVIHPESKEEVADRMAFSAMGMVYGAGTDYTAATVSSYEIKGNEIFVKFRDVGDGLVCGGNTLKGFAVAGSDRIFVGADAEITAPDTVKISAEGISQPQAFSYAYCVDNGDSNLFASVNGEKTLPASEYISEKTENSHYRKQMSFADCDSDSVWYTEDDALSAYYPLFTADKAEIAFSSEAGLEGNGMKITSDSRCFSVSPTLTYKDGLSEKSFSSAETDYSDYGYMSFYVRNDGEADVTFDGLRLYENSVVWYSPEVAGTLDTEYVIPADGEYHRITLDLGRVYHLGNECSLSYDNEKLGNIKSLEFRFSCKEKAAELSLDSIRFTPSAEDCGTRFDVSLGNADDPIEFFTGLVLFVFGKFASLFGM